MKTRMELWKTYRDEIDKNIVLKKAVHQTNEKVKVLYEKLIDIFPEYKSLYETSDKITGLELEEVEGVSLNNTKKIDQILSKIKDFEAGDEQGTLFEELVFSSGGFEDIYNKIKSANTNDKELSLINNVNTRIKTKFIKLGEEEVVKKIRIAIDGPSGSGKTTIARILADRLGYTYISTGLVYRGIAYKVIDQKINVEDESAVASILKPGMIELLAHEIIFLEGNNITTEVRSDAVSQMASKVSAIPEVRKYSLELQQEYATDPGVIMDGRDTTFNVMPNAELKIFLDTSAEIRAKRRAEQNKSLGYDTDYDFILKEIKERDYRDRNRSVDPLHKTEDAIFIDATDLSIEECVDKILNLAHKASSK